MGWGMRKKTGRGKGEGDEGGGGGTWGRVWEKVE